jgi:hypothetical protein
MMRFDPSHKCSQKEVGLASEGRKGICWKSRCNSLKFSHVVTGQFASDNAWDFWGKPDYPILIPSSRWGSYRQEWKVHLATRYELTTQEIEIAGLISCEWA